MPETQEPFGDDTQIAPDHRVKLTAMAAGLDQFLNDGASGRARKSGFVLLAFPLNCDPGSEQARVSYISNGVDRGDIILLFKQMIARFSGQAEVTGQA